MANEQIKGPWIPVEVREGFLEEVAFMPKLHGTGKASLGEMKWAGSVQRLGDESGQAVAKCLWTTE